jgi:hypothetical protein
LPQLAKELREFIINIVATKEGHLGAGLGVVKLTIALQYLFIPKTILYQDKNTCALRFGFGHLDIEEMEIVIHKLKSAFKEVTKKVVEH